MEKNNQEQQRYMELQALQQQMNQIQQQITLFNNQITEFHKLKDNLKNLKKVKPGEEMFSPLGAGIYVKAEIKDTKEVLMRVGSNIIVTKTIDEADKLIEKQIKEMEAAIKQMEHNLQEAALLAQKLEQEIITLSAKTK